MDSITKLGVSHFSIHIAGDFIGDEYMGLSEIKQNFEKSLRNLRKSGYNIKYYGVLTGKRKNLLLQKSDIFLLPSFFKSEACPLSIIEAINFNCVVITTKWKYIYSFTNGKAIYVDIKSSDEISDQLKKLLNKSYYNKCLVKQKSLVDKKLSNVDYKLKIKNLIKKYELINSNNRI